MPFIKKTQLLEETLINFFYMKTMVRALLNLYSSIDQKHQQIKLYQILIHLTCIPQYNILSNRQTASAFFTKHTTSIISMGTKSRNGALLPLLFYLMTFSARTVLPN